MRDSRLWFLQSSNYQTHKYTSWYFVGWFFTWSHYGCRFRRHFQCYNLCCRHHHPQHRRRWVNIKRKPTLRTRTCARNRIPIIPHSCSRFLRFEVLFLALILFAQQINRTPNVRWTFKILKRFDLSQTLCHHYQNDERHFKLLHSFGNHSTNSNMYAGTLPFHKYGAQINLFFSKAIDKRQMVEIASERGDKRCYIYIDRSRMFDVWNCGRWINNCICIPCNTRRRHIDRKDASLASDLFRSSICVWIIVLYGGKSLISIYWMCVRVCMCERLNDDDCFKIKSIMCRFIILLWRR